jgi:hypothetical protein
MAQPIAIIVEKMQSKDKARSPAWPLCTPAHRRAARRPIMPASMPRGAIRLSPRVQDYRYMATSDLQGALEQDGFKADDQTERTLARLILQQLEDPSGDISSLAVKWYVALLPASRAPAGGPRPGAPALGANAGAARAAWRCWCSA